MSMKRFVEITSQRPVRIYRGRDQIPGTIKVRTYCGNASLYSKESSLERIRSKPERPISFKK